MLRLAVSYGGRRRKSYGKSRRNAGRPYGWPVHRNSASSALFEECRIENPFSDRRRAGFAAPSIPLIRRKRESGQSLLGRLRSGTVENFPAWHFRSKLRNCEAKRAVGPEQATKRRTIHLFRMRKSGVHRVRSVLRSANPWFIRQRFETGSVPYSGAGRPDIACLQQPVARGNSQPACPSTELIANGRSAAT